MGAPRTGGHVMDDHRGAADEGRWRTIEFRTALPTGVVKSSNDGVQRLRPTSRSGAPALRDGAKAIWLNLDDHRGAADEGRWRTIEFRTALPTGVVKSPNHRSE